MKKNIIIILTLLTWVLSGAHAKENSEGTKFIETSWTEILKMAKEQQKPIFIDCYTSWCGPCRQMLRDVFPQKQVGDYLNENFVVTKFDMEKGDGVDLARKFEVRAFPTYLILDSNGKMIDRQIGAIAAENLIGFCKNAAGDNSLSAMQKKYADGYRDNEFLLDYMIRLEMGGLSKDLAAVRSDYLANLDPSLIPANKRVWSVVRKNHMKVDDPLYKYISNNRKQLTELYGKEVERFRASCWAFGTYNFCQDENFDKKGYNEYMKRMKQAGIEGYDSLKNNSDIANAQKVNDWKTYLKLINKDKKARGGELKDSNLYEWTRGVVRRVETAQKEGKSIAEASLDRMALESIRDWCGEAVKRIKANGFKSNSVERPGGVVYGTFLERQYKAIDNYLKTQN